jgi:7-cyano-7-deazaguanine synthase
MMHQANPSVGLLFSGGLDSSILAGHLLAEGFQVFPLYVAGGLFWEETELAWARRYLRAIGSPRLAALTVLKMPVADVYDQHWAVTGQQVPNADSPDEAVYLPGRNPLLLLKARIWCQMKGVRRLAIGCLGTNPFADATDEFFNSFSAILNRATDSEVKIDRPLARLTKREVMQLGQSLPLELTFSCIQPRNGLHCGQCNKCAERRAAFALLASGDPTRYASPTSVQFPTNTTIR